MVDGCLAPVVRADPATSAAHGMTFGAYSRPQAAVAAAPSMCASTNYEAGMG